MNLSIEVRIDEDLAMKVAEELGMDMEVVEDPMEPARPVTFTEVDTWLEGRMKEALVGEFSGAIKAITLREATAKAKAEREQAEATIDRLVNAAIALGNDS